MMMPDADAVFAPGFRNVVWCVEPDGTQTMVSADLVEISMVPPGSPSFKELDADV